MEVGHPARCMHVHQPGWACRAAPGVHGRSCWSTPVARQRGSRWTSRFRQLAGGGHRRTWSRRGRGDDGGGWRAWLCAVYHLSYIESFSALLAAGAL